MDSSVLDIHDVVPLFAVGENGQALITEEQYQWLCNYANEQANNAEHYSDCWLELRRVQKQSDYYLEVIQRLVKKLDDPERNGSS